MTKKRTLDPEFRQICQAARFLKPEVILAIQFQLWRVELNLRLEVLFAFCKTESGWGSFDKTQSGAPVAEVVAIEVGLDEVATVKFVAVKGVAAEGVGEGIEVLIVVNEAI